MRSLRKTLVTALIVAMVCGLAGTAFASTVAGKAFTDIGGHAYAKELTMARALGIMMGDAGTTIVRPDAPITRAEFCMVVVRMLGREQLAVALSTYQPTFTDEVPTWAWGHVNVAVSMGIIKGYGDGRFGGSDNVTHAEALAMLVRATGHDPGVIGMWPVNYMIAGYDLGIIGKVDAFAMLPATRGEVAHFVYNAMDIKRGTGTGAGYNPAGAEKILRDTGDAAPPRRQWTGLAGAFNAAGKTLIVGGHARALADSVYLWNYTAFADLYNTNVRAVANALGKVVFVEPFTPVNVVKGTFKEYDNTGTTKYLVLADGTKVVYTVGTTTLSLNKGADAAMTEGGQLANGDAVNINTADGKAVFVDAFRVNILNKLVKKVDVKGVAGWTQDSRITLEDDTYFKVSTVITLNGTAAALGDLKANDVAYIATKDAATADLSEAVNIEAIRQTVQGAWVSDRRVYTEAGKFTWYFTLRLADGTTKELKWYVQLTTDPTLPTAGSTVIYGLNKAGDARVQLAATLSTNYVKVVSAATGPTGGKYNVTFDMRGSSVAYISYAHTWPNEIGKIGKITVSAATGEVTNFEILWAPVISGITGIQRGQVFSVDATNNVVSIRVYDEALGLTHNYLVTHADFIAYQSTTAGAIGAFIPTADLKVGDRVYFATVSGTDLRVLAIFRKFTQTTWTPH
ncbi:MAG: S-layer homology domain-containing protein [bacterium]|nr:S-layer homology domain-containing protein [bacterium]